MFPGNPMDANQLAAFHEATMVAAEALVPMTVRIGVEDVLANGTSAGQKFVTLGDGGQAQNREINFAIRKTVFRRLAIHERVEVDGQVYLVRKVWGDDPYDAAYSYRAEQWFE